MYVFLDQSILTSPHKYIQETKLLAVCLMNVEIEQEFQLDDFDGFMALNYDSLMYPSLT